MNRHVPPQQSLSCDAGIVPDLRNPLLESLGVTATCWREGYVEMRLRLVSTMLNRSGVAHGGIICTLLDAAAGYSGIYAPPGAIEKRGLTLSLTSNFLANGKSGVLTAKGMLDRNGRSIYFARSEVWLDDELLLATAVGTYRHLRGDSARHGVPDY